MKYGNNKGVHLFFSLSLQAFEKIRRKISGRSASQVMEDLMKSDMKSAIA